MLGGVCASFARYFGVDATLIRVLWAMALPVFGTGLLAYIICWILIPEE